MMILNSNIVLLLMINAVHGNPLDMVLQVMQQVGSNACPGNWCLEPEAEAEATTAALTTDTAALTTAALTTAALTTAALTTEALTTAAPALIQVRELVVPVNLTSYMTYAASLKNCEDMGGEPFIPKTPEDFEVINNFTRDYLQPSYDYMWIPVNDLSTEGQLQWSNGEDAMTDAQELNWADNEFMFYNDEDEDYDCATFNPYMVGIYMTPCSRFTLPMICQIMKNITDA